MKKNFAFLTLTLLVLFIYPANAMATSLTIQSPAGALEVGNTYDFTVKIDTEGKKIADLDFDIDCDPRYAQFVDLVKGDFFDNVEYTPPGADGKTMATGKLTASKSGAGDAAITGQKIIADAPAGTAICAVSLVIPGSGSAAITVTPVARGGTNEEATTLPQSGIYDSFVSFALLGLAATAVGIYFKKKSY